MKHKLISIKESAYFLNISVSWCYKLAERGVLRGIRIAGRNNPWQFRYGDVFRLSIRRSFTRMQKRARELLAAQGLDYLGRPLGSAKYRGFYNPPRAPQPPDKE